MIELALGARSSNPLALASMVARGSTWYLVAAVEGELRTFRASRVQNAEVTKEPCLRPAGFDLASHWEQSKRDFKENLPRYPVTVRASPDIVERMHTSGRYARILNVEASVPPDERGWPTLHILFEVAWEACEYLLSFGPKVEVLEPIALRDELIIMARATLEHYERTT